MKMSYLITGIVMALVGGLTPGSILTKIPYGFVLALALIGFGVFVVIIGIMK